MINREIENTVYECSKTFKALTILGPRQTGKTTLVKKCFPDYQYYNFENPDTRDLALSDPRAFMRGTGDGAVFDEIQKAPEILSYAQEYLDNSNKKGVYIFTGSNQSDVHKRITQTLAGRTAILRLLPFSIKELQQYNDPCTKDEILYKGLFPGIHNEGQNPTIAYRSYFETYLERDLRQMIQVKDLRLFQRFMRLCAGRIGQLYNANNLANETGVSIPTIQDWISVLEASYIVFLLEPFHANISKRLIKSSKIYFNDPGFASYLLGIENDNQIARDPLHGHLFENMVVLELLKHKYNHGLEPNLSFYRDNHQNEVDCLMKSGSGYTAFEIKSSETFHTMFYKGLDYIKKTMPGKIQKSYLVYSGLEEQLSDTNHSLINFNRIGEVL